mgnify:FL=1
MGCLFASTQSYAQKVEDLTDAQVEQFVNQAKASGLSEEEIEAMARSRGFTAADIAKMRQRISGLQTTTQKADAPDSPVVRTPPPDVNSTKATPQAESSSLPTFGASLFSGSSSTFEPNLRIATPRNYQLGPDDELVIDVYGNAQQSYRPKISPEGTIRLENLSPIFVSGLTIEQAEQRIVGRLRQLYAGLNSASSGIYAQVTLGNIRSIKVTLIGQVVRPGTYTLSSLATVFNALYLSGGPDPARGSFRDIRVYRGNRLIRTLDIYDFLLRADQSDNVRLQDQDIVFVNHFDTRVELTGEVKQPAIFEVRKGETLRNVLNFAGGYTDKAYTASLTLRRNTPKELQIVTITANEIPTLIPQRGDRYSVGAIIGRYENRVSISGAVFRPGEFALQKNATLSQLIRNAEGLREDAFLNRATIRRLRPNLDPEIISVDLGKLLRGESEDILLQREDEVSVQSVNNLRESRTVSIEGAVNQPGNFTYADSMTVANLVVLGGGFTDGATASRIEIARRVKEDTVGLPASQNVRIISLAIDDNLRLNEVDARMVLKPFDQVYVRTSPRYEPQKMVYIGGEVFYPGNYAIRDKNERIADLIARAGGIRPEAFLRAARFTRLGELISVDIGQILSNPQVTGNLLVQVGDSILIPRKVEIVRINGQVLNPAIVDFDPSKRFRNYIDDSGGFTTKAQPRKTYVTYANGRIRPTKSFLFFRSYPRPEPGMTVVVPTKPPKEDNKLSPAERVAVATGITSLAAVVLTVTRLILGR